MTIEDFIAKTQQVIAEDGLDAYLPTLVVETRWDIEIAVLQDAPQDAEIEVVAQDWAAQVAKNHDYVLAFRVDDAHFKVISRRKSSRSDSRATLKK